VLSAGLGVFANVAAPSALLTERQGRFVMEATTDEWPSLVVQTSGHQTTETVRRVECQPQDHRWSLIAPLIENYWRGLAGEKVENVRQQPAPLGQQEATQATAFALPEKE